MASRSANVTTTGDEDVQTVCEALSLAGTAPAHFSQRAARAVLIVNPAGNSQAVLVGDSGYQVIAVYPGDDPFRIRCTRMDQVYVKNAVTATQTVYGVAEVQA